MITNEKERILIVDDERMNLTILADILKTKYTVLLAKNGKQALERALKQQPDLVLLDIMMPDMDGYQVLRAMKENDVLKDIPVIFITALSDAEDEEKGLVLGAVDYITKPFHSAIVLARVNNHLKIVRQRKLIESIALLDDLTEIPNRRNYEKRLSNEWKRAIREKIPLSIAMLDVDYFKQYNDNYGHPQGDHALKLVASVISNILKRPADFVARVGGEEFVIIMPHNEQQGAYELAEIIRASIENLQIEHNFSAVSNILTVSIGGTSCIPKQENQLKDFIDLIDQMLYKAKKEGRNRVVWSD